MIEYLLSFYHSSEDNMKCYCKYNEDVLLLMVEEVEEEYKQNLRSAWYEPTDTGFIKRYPMTDKTIGVNIEDIERIIKNFPLIAPSMFVGIFDWEKVLLFLAQKFSEHNIEWYIVGSISEALLGVEIHPHDLDIIVHTSDFFKVKDILSDYVVEPFVDNKGSWVVRYFGRLCIDGACVDIASDEKMNLNHQNPQYELLKWKNCDIYIEPIQKRYQVEQQRNRKDRIEAIEKYLNSSTTSKY